MLDPEGIEVVDAPSGIAHVLEQLGERYARQSLGSCFL
jgi:hypothetical protein